MITRAEVWGPLVIAVLLAALVALTWWERRTTKWRGRIDSALDDLFDDLGPEHVPAPVPTVQDGAPGSPPPTRTNDAVQPYQLPFEQPADWRHPQHICGPRCCPQPYGGPVILGRRCRICGGPDGPECGKCFADEDARAVRRADR